jgi:hypothetical protein
MIESCTLWFGVGSQDQDVAWWYRLKYFRNCRLGADKQVGVLGREVVHDGVVHSLVSGLGFRV